MMGESSPVVMDTRIQLPTLSCEGISDGDVTETVDIGVGRVVTGCEGDVGEVRPATVRVRTTSAIKGTELISPILHETYSFHYARTIIRFPVEGA
jgi:hypothetical protein